MRRSIGIVAVLVVLSFVLVGGPSLLASPSTSEIAPETESESDAEIVRPTDGESGFWPYLNSRKAFEQRSPINVVVIGETETIVRLLIEDGDSDWQETAEDQEEADPGTHAVVGSNESDVNESVVDDSFEVGATNISWSRTSGATRYTYVEPHEDGEGRWVTETAQIHDGTYYGDRYHIRMYESPNPDEPWVAMQTHHEHFDWFTLRHRVDGSQAAQTRLEADLMALPQVDDRHDVSRVNLGNRNSRDADGWATFVDLAGMAMVGFLVAGTVLSDAFGRTRRRVTRHLTEADRRRLAVARERIDPRHLLLGLVIVGVIVGVRLGGIALERTGALSMHGIAAVLYPAIALGLPIATYLLASGLERRLDAAVVASGALAVAIWLDYGVLGVDSLPIDVIVHRMLLVVAIGLLAGGAARRATRDSRFNGLVLAGAVLWALLLSGALFGYL